MMQALEIAYVTSVLAFICLDIVKTFKEEKAIRKAAKEPTTDWFIDEITCEFVEYARW